METSRRSDPTAGPTGALAGAGSVNATPHDPQKWSPGSLLAPQVGQATSRGLPHWEQNLRPGRFSARQEAQVILLAKYPRRSRCA
jgi:hypothetical protein